MRPHYVTDWEVTKIVDIFALKILYLELYLVVVDVITFNAALYYCCEPYCKKSYVIHM